MELAPVHLSRLRIPVEIHSSPPSRTISSFAAEDRGLIGTQSRAAVSATIVSTGCRSKVERLMTFSTSLVAVWYSSDS